MSKPLATRFFHGGALNCQKEIDNEIDNPNSPWLQLSETFQNIQGKGIATILGKHTMDTKNVIIKVQLAEEALKEYKMGQLLKENNIEGFVDFICYFTCDGDKKYIESFAVFNEKSKLCNKHGVSMGVIIMPYFVNKSFEDFLKTYSRPDKKVLVKNILTTVLKSYFAAYSTLKFTHGDFFAKNIVLNRQYIPAIIDFEKSKQNVYNKCITFWRDVDDLIGDIVRYTQLYGLDEVSRTYILKNMAINKEPTFELISQMCRTIHIFIFV